MSKQQARRAETDTSAIIFFTFLATIALLVWLSSMASVEVSSEVRVKAHDTEVQKSTGIGEGLTIYTIRDNQSKQQYVLEVKNGQPTVSEVNYDGSSRQPPGDGVSVQEPIEVSGH